MPVEVEQKFHCDNLGAVREALFRRGATGGETMEQVDRYYRHPVRDFAATDEAFRLRTVGDKNCLTYKGPKLDAQTKTRCEEEVAIADGPEAAATCDRILQRLGFSSVAEVRKRRQTFHFRQDDIGVEAALDAVASVGEFVELETIVDGEGSDRPGVDRARQALAAAAGALGLNSQAVERRSYLELQLASL
jgi:adenylate cyclase class 2